MNLGTVEDGILILPLRPEWRELPAADAADPAAAIGAIVDELAPSAEAAPGIRAGLTAVTSLAHGMAPGPRRSYALVRRPDGGLVDALLTFRLVGRGEVTVDDYFEAASRPLAADGVDVVNRTVERIQLPSGLGVASHDFTLDVDGEGVGNPALERAFLALFPEGTETVVEFSLLTQDLGLFDDVQLFLAQFAAGDNPETPEGGR